MNPQKRSLTFFRVESGMPITARCSVCHRLFEIREPVALGNASKTLVAMFDAHVCNEDVAQAAFRVVKESTER